MSNAPGNSLSVFSLLDALRRRKFIIIVPTVLLTIGFGVFAKYQPNRYRATAVIAAEQTTPPEYLKHVAPAPLNIEEHIWTVREVLFSDAVLQEAAKQTKKYRDVQGNLTPQQVEEFRSELNVPDLIKIDSEHTFKLIYDSLDRYEAMNVSNKLAESFVQHASAQHQQKTEEAATVIDGQFDALRKRMDAQSAEIHKYKSTIVNALPDHIDDNIRGAETAKEEIQERETKISEEQSHKTQIERELQDLEAKGVLDQPVIHEKTPDENKLDELQLQLNELRTKFTDSHPSVAALKVQIASLERTIASQPKKGRNEPSPTYLRYSGLKSELEGIDQRIAGYRRDIGSLAARVESYSRRVEATPQHERVIEDMNRELKVGDLQYHALLDKKLDNNLAKGFEQSESGIAFKVTEAASLPQLPYSPQRERLVLMGLAVGLGLGLLLAFVLEQNDTTFATVDDFQAFTTLPLAGIVPNIQNGKKNGKKSGPKTPVVTIDDPDSVAAEQYRILAMKVQQQCDATNAKAVMITSAAGGEGKSLTALNLAAALTAMTDGRVLLIDADMRKPRVGEYLKLPVAADKGFHNVLIHSDGNLEKYIEKVKNLYVIPGGISQANPVAALSTAKARALFDQMKREFAYIVVDAPPVLPIADSHILAGLSDKVLFVVRARQTARELFQHAIEGFDAANLLGAVLNDVDYQRSRYAYAYEYYKKTA